MDRKLLARKTERRLKARRQGKLSPLRGLSLFGLVGWSVAVPTLLALALGIWLDRRWPGDVSWTLTLILIGVVLGCWNAWYWIGRAADDERGEE